MKRKCIIPLVLSLSITLSACGQNSSSKVISRNQHKSSQFQDNVKSSNTSSSHAQTKDSQTFSYSSKVDQLHLTEQQLKDWVFAAYKKYLNNNAVHSNYIIHISVSHDGLAYAALKEKDNQDATEGLPFRVTSSGSLQYFLTQPPVDSSAERWVTVSDTYFTDKNSSIDTEQTVEDYQSLYIPNGAGSELYKKFQTYRDGYYCSVPQNMYNASVIQLTNHKVTDTVFIGNLSEDSNRDSKIDKIEAEQFCQWLRTVDSDGYNDNSLQSNYDYWVANVK